MNWEEIHLKKRVDLAHSFVPWTVKKIRGKNKSVYLQSIHGDERWVLLDEIYSLGTYSESALKLSSRQVEQIKASFSGIEGPFYSFLTHNSSFERSYYPTGLLVKIYTNLVASLIGLVIEYLNVDMQFGETFKYKNNLVQIVKTYPQTGHLFVSIRRRYENPPYDYCSVSELELTVNNNSRIY